MPTPLDQLPAHAAHSRTLVHVVVETPKGERNKVAFDPALGAFLLKGVQEITDLSPELLHEIEHFFSSYNSVQGGEIKVLHRVGSKKAHALLARALQ